MKTKELLQLISIAPKKYCVLFLSRPQITPKIGATPLPSLGRVMREAGHEAGQALATFTWTRFHNS